MRRRHSAVVGGVAVAALAITMAPLAQANRSAATPTIAPADEPAATAQKQDDKPHPLGDAQRRLREDAVDKLVSGDAQVVTKAGKKVIEVESNAAPGVGPQARGGKPQSRYVEYDVERTASVFTVLTEFGDQTTPATGGDAGPLRNEIPEPDRDWDGGATDDNSTLWRADFNRNHYLDLMFANGKESFKDFFLKQSNGRFEVTGDVSDWVQVPFNEARYGSNEIAESDGYWNYIKDTAQAWYDDQVAQGKSTAEIQEYLAQFDQWDRYDYDGDGDFNEPDGYIDHFQAIHAGAGEEAGGGAQGTDAIWSHRWYAFSNQIGRTGPEGNLLGGVPIGDTGLFIGDYTTEPENGGLGVFTHEFAHDLGLPDLYATDGGDNGTGFWTLMSGGSWLNPGKEDIGSSPGYMGAWEKLQLGWLDYSVVESGTKKTLTLGPADKDHRTRPQAVVASLPNKQISTEYNTPRSGEYEWWSGSADNLNNSLTRSIDLTGATDASVSAAVAHDIEEGYDFLVAEVSTDGTTWEQVGETIDGGDLSWQEYDFDLTPYVGSEVDFRFRYQTDGGVSLAGAFIDDVSVTVDGQVVFSDDVESGDNGWVADGFTRTTGTTTEEVSHYYLAEYRRYSGYDKNLKTGPYNFGWADTKPDWVERFPYQDGLLVWYIDNEYSDNNSATHPGSGQVLPVDARPKAIKFPNGALLGNRRQPWDATFGWDFTDKVSFHNRGQRTTINRQLPKPVFNDSDPQRYYDPANPQGSVKVAGTGTSIAVLLQGGDSMLLHVNAKR